MDQIHLKQTFHCIYNLMKHAAEKQVSLQDFPVFNLIQSPKQLSPASFL